MSHVCHARGCAIGVPPEMLMCKAHWSSVPRNIQQGVWRWYREGQCEDKRPSAAWHEAASAAVGYIVLLEGGKLRIVEVKALISYGYGRWIEAEYVRRYGEEKRLKIKEQLAKLALGDR